MAATTEQQRQQRREAARRRRRRQNRRALAALVLLTACIVLLVCLCRSCGRPAEQPSDVSAASSASTTAPAHTIEQRDGVTYADGILVVNKTYSLPADYDPGGLTDECYDAFLSLQQDAAAEGLNLYIASGFRSYDAQSSLYDSYVANDGQEDADRYSARPGHSEHQTGLAIDLNDVSDTFGDTAEGQWVAAHAHEYGFILRYPQDKEEQTGYMYEPWHIRYVGTDAAAAIYESGLCLEEYYGLTSVYAD